MRILRVHVPHMAMEKSMMIVQQQPSQTNTAISNEEQKPFLSNPNPTHNSSNNHSSNGAVHRHSTANNKPATSTTNETIDNIGKTAWRLLVQLLVLVILAGLVYIYDADETFIINHYDQDDKPDNNNNNNSRIYQEAVQFLESRRSAFIAKDKIDAWTMRGIGWLHHHHNVLLVAQITRQQHHQQHPTTTDRYQSYTVTIQNVLSATKGFQCSKLTIWVRLLGPEIFSGKAIPVDGLPLHSRVNAADNEHISENKHNKHNNQPPSCHWIFPLRVTFPGDYRLDAKLLLYNGQAPVHFQNCTIFDEDFQAMIQNNSLKETHQHDSFFGFKFYFPYQSCCEVCTRTKNCVHWAYPPIKHPDKEGCELYYEDDQHQIRRRTIRLPQQQQPPQQQKQKQQPPYVFDQSPHHHHHHPRYRRDLARQQPAHGLPRQEETAYFLGCGWSFWLASFRCEDGALDDAVYVQQHNYTFIQDDITTACENTSNLNLLQPQQQKQQKLEESRPLCTSQDEIDAKGRWLQLPFPDDDTGECPSPFQNDPKWNSHFNMTAWDGRHPKCWFRENIADIGLRCLEGGCYLMRRSLWKSTLKANNTRWFGRWEPYRCRYREFTDDQLQRCINTRRIVGIDVQGASIAQFLEDYIGQRLAFITFPEDGILNITLTTLSFPHLLWHETPEQWIRTLTNRYRRHHPPSEFHEKYWVSGFFYSSEREPATHVERVFQLNQLALQLLSNNNNDVDNTTTITMLEATDLTAAFTYDTSTQGDGLHIIGPPMKMIVTKFFHHLCRNMSF